MAGATRSGAGGFTLLELVLVMVILGTLAYVLVNVLTGPMRAYLDTERRARLVDLADVALARMTREMRLALPNSVRIGGGGTAIEFLRTVDGARYRAMPDTAGLGTPLSFTTSAQAAFDVLGGLASLALTLRDDQLGQEVTLLQQIHLGNQP